MTTSPSRSFNIKADANNNTIPIQISELAGIKAENLGLATWGAAVVLADVLYRWKDEPWTQRKNTENKPHTLADLQEKIHVLELGAGTALAGLAAATLWQLPTVLTDLAPVVPGIAHNVALNKSFFAERSTPVYAGALDWMNPTLLHLHPEPNDQSPVVLNATHTKATIILAADTCYTEDHPELVTNTVETWLAPGPDARVIFCYPLRMAYIDHARNLWEQMESKGLVCLEEGRESSEELWGEFEPAPYEWSVWGWEEHHPEAVTANGGA